MKDTKRAPFQVLVLPYRITATRVLYAVFRRNRSTGSYWQGIAGGGEGSETPLAAARREALEEAGIESKHFLRLKTLTMIAAFHIDAFRGSKDFLVLPEYCFGVRVEDRELSLSDEHTEYRWLSYKAATKILHWDSNKTALWELDARLQQMHDAASDNSRKRADRKKSLN
jgi:dATP pyrophosphohydrolase